MISGSSVLFMIKLIQICAVIFLGYNNLLMVYVRIYLDLKLIFLLFHEPTTATVN